MSEDKPRLDPRIVRTRQLIKDALIELLQEMDIEKITVNRIAERATINRVTFYLHYRDIPDMFEKMAEEMVGNIQRVLNADPSKPDAGDKMDTHMIVKLLEHIAENSKFYKVVLGPGRAPVFRERLLKLLSEIIQQRTMWDKDEYYGSKAGVSKEIAMWYGPSVLIGIIIAWIRSDFPYTPHYLAEQLSLLLLDKDG
ncbi:TetR/AcrR family transcriptional regulator [Paenibacillus sp. CN-4]|uniref:TetR/AcrR family transcriptional regulator n=1 Tax=Paenibacillus nanchangensis TaxID=3348343 RepID=UPI00397B499A